ncbi:glycerol-3-phosphate dehydrogenase [Gordonia polyisoprenivorans NBRC 16320 = JCM 10675]|uniref:FAD-dependent oxidoreductase n=1 Tax=Gordonia polyisoprenivorans TaxID=84595 RepID=A0A846WUB0_9ACTN|nr:FAD-dependent oxidoreductase [Gordonia polyisoprenivorans]MBE7191652.1 FAD-dependent oxidoreductase [Gordonia polyisoprenivorans]NKY04340.1 FAD-dependent oxidoreductase [Gordonia polyisoprenivorans]WCB37126.1 FAD-dependent oxidoreductase [Gordonia polyisoprenivorans]GAB23359.1 glycerol-3-phosphate dehydrogenase [Gordonia polyisoprenivorans NBRC 16320 = JCM 10675]
MSPAPRLRRNDFGGRTTTVDVLVIGGGITGAAIAYEAASRGLDVALVERSDFGGATSAATGKLIHGGLRYLKQFDIRLVRESLAERRTLMSIAPNLVSPIPMVLPDPGIVERLGLTTYDLLSADRNRIGDPTKHIPRHRILDHDELAARGLADLHSGALFHDAMMAFPERLTLAFLRSAAEHGALVANGVAVQTIIGGGGRVVGAHICDRLTGEVGEVRARVTVNATGPWARDVLAGSPLTETLAGPPPTVRSEGIYLVTRELSTTMVLTVSGHGHFSFAPWRGLSLIGPTETPYRGAVEDWRLTRASIETFLDAINSASMVPVRLDLDDVVAAYGGLRPLTEQNGEDTYNASRASELVDHRRDGLAGIVTATGGKYTNSRAFAQKAVTTLSEREGLSVRRSSSASTLLAGCLPTGEHVRQAGGLDARTVAIVEQIFGSDADDVLARAIERPDLARTVTHDGIPLAAVAHSARHESPRTLLDLLLRRTGIGTVGRPADDDLTEMAQIAGAELGWDAARITREIADARAGLGVPVD